MTAPPSLVNGPSAVVKKKLEYDQPCPKCSKEMRITDISEGAPIACGNCGNVTWRIAYTPPWWSKTSRFALSLLGTFILGVISSLVASTIYEKYTQSRNTSAYNNTKPTITQKR